MYGSLPKRQKSFDIDLEGDNTGLQYKGTFTVKTGLSLQEQHAVELNRTRMMADYKNPTVGLQRIAISLSELETRIVEAPAWWKELGNGYDVIDINIVEEIFLKSMTAEADWKASLKKKAEEAKEEARPL